MDDENSSPIISGDVENIIIKLEPLEEFFHDEDSSTGDGVNCSNEIDENEEKDFHDKCLEPDENQSNIVQIPFYLENYFVDDDEDDDDDDVTYDIDQLISHHIETNRLACSYCRIIFPTEKLLHEHLILHIDINRMGCNVCDKDLNIAEKYQLHVMAITRQSIYFCDLCKKSCAGVVRSKDQTRTEGKAYACHDCEIQITGKPYILGGAIPNKQQTWKHSNCKPIFQSIKKEDGNLAIEIKLNGSKLNPDIFFHKCTYCDAFFAQSVTLSRHLRVRHNVTRDMMNVLRNSKLAYEELTMSNFQFIDNQSVLSESEELKKLETIEVSEETKTAAAAVETTTTTTTTTINTITTTTTTTSTTTTKANDKECFETKVTTTTDEFNQRDDVSYSENYNVNKHLREKHKKKRAKYTCNTCLKQFRLRRCYNSHLNFHETRKNHQCDICELEFFTRYKLQQHMKIHNPEKKESVTRKKNLYKCEKKTLTDRSQKRNLRRSRLRNS